MTEYNATQNNTNMPQSRSELISLGLQVNLLPIEPPLQFTCFQLSCPDFSWFYFIFFIFFHFPFQLNPNDYSISLILRFVGSVVSPLSNLNDTKFGSLFGFKYWRIRVASQILWSR